MRNAPTVIVQIRQLSIHTNHGISEAEQEVGQRMLFDIDVVPIECPTTETDDLDGTIDYGEVVDLLAATATESTFLTVERLATVIAERTLDSFEAESVMVRVHKAEPPIPFTVESGGVELRMTRESGSTAP